MKPCDLGGGTIKAGRQPERRAVRKLHRRIVRVDPLDHENGQKHLFLPERMFGRCFRNERLHEQAVRQLALAKLLATDERPCAW